MYKKYLDKIRKMTEEELYLAVYTDPLTGLLNRRALDEAEYNVVGIIDVDSLKYVNDFSGHRMGDLLLKNIAKYLTNDINQGCGMLSVYRVCGDEFVVTGFGSCDIESMLSMIQKQNNQFSFGVGKDLKEADENLRVRKKERIGTGERAPRGECPPWF